MSITLVRKSQIRPLNIIRSDINTTTSGSALITKVIAGTGLALSSSTGVNPGTGDVTIALSIATASVLGGVKIGSGLTVAVDGTISVTTVSTTWGSITGTLSNQTDLQAALNAKYNNPTGTSSQYIDGTGAYQTFPSSLATGFVRHQVKAGVAINKGQAVYVTSSDGTNMIVGLASNASEATSSKTMGLLDATVSINGFANVVTEGLLAGLNTVGANSGDPVWLGVGGNLIYGLANKPYAPAHLVFIGIVTRVNANNGEIFVKVQNGFELDELHDVDLKTTLPINGHLLGYNGTLWVNKTIIGWLGYTPQDAATAITTSNIGSQSVNHANTSDTSTNTYRAIVEDTRVAERTPNEYDDYRVSWEFTNQIQGVNSAASTWWAAMTIQGWHDGYAAWQIIGPSSAAIEDFYLRSGVNDTWNTSRRIWHNGDFTSTNISNWNTAYSWGNHATQSYATQTYVNNAIANLVDSAPGTLDTLNELAAALGDDPNFATTVTNNIAGKVSKSGDTMTGNLNWAQTDRGLTWGMNTDGAYIKFFNTGDGDSDSRLEYATSDNGDEYHRWVIGGVERMNLRTEGLNVNGVIYSSGYGNSTEWYTAYTWGNHAGLYALAGHTHTFASITSKPTTIAGYGITNAYTDTQIQNFFNGANAITGYNKSNWDTAYGWGNHASAGYRVNSISNTAYVYATSYRTENYDFTLDPRLSIDSMSIKLWDNYFNGSGLGVDYGSLLDIHGRGGHVHSQFYMDASNLLWYRSSPYAGGWNTWQQIWTSGTLTNLNQLINGPGYITGYTETDTLQSVTSRGFSTNTNIWIKRPANKVDNASCTELPSRVEFNNAFVAGSTGYTVFHYPTPSVFRIYGDYDGNLGGLQPDIHLGLGYLTVKSSGSNIGNIGIGTTSPSSRLHVEGNATPGNYAAYIHNSSGGGNVLKLYNHDWDVTDYLLYATNGGTAASGFAFVVDGNGRVGISTTTPTNKLQIGSVGSSGYGGNDFVIGNGTQVMAFYQSSTISTWYTNTNFALLASGAGSVGNLGVGNDNPQFKLDVTGTGRFTGNVSIGTNYNGFALNVNGTTYIIGGNLFVNVGQKVVNTSDTSSIAFLDDVLDVKGALIPITDSTYNLGTTTLRWRTIYAADLNLTGAATINGSTVWHAGNLTNLNQLANGPGYITGYTETDTLASVTARGATTNTASVFRGGLYGQKAQVEGNYTTAALWTESYDTTTTGIAFHISGVVGKFLEMRTDGILYWEDQQVWTAGNLTSLSQLSNDPGYLTSLPSHNHDDRYLVKGGGWYGLNLPGSRWGGFAVDGGEISFGNGLPNANQMGILIDGAYLAGENNGFWSLPSDNNWNGRRGMSWNGTYLDFTTNSPTAQFANLRLANGFEIQQGGSNYGRFNSWVHLNGHYGLYSDINGAHIYPNNGSYGSWRIEGSRNNYRGLQFATGINGDVSLMIHDNSNITGFHNASYDWQFYWSAGTLYCFKDNYGGGTQATVLDSSNYTNYAATSGHTHDLMRYSLRAPGNVDSLTSANFREQLFGTTSNGWAISTARWNSVPSGLSGMNMYGTMFAWSGSDTHGFIATDYSTANIQVGGGSGNSITWRATLIHSSNIGSYALTSYTETDTLNSVTTRGASTGNAIEVGGLTVSTRDVDVVTHQGRFQVYNASATGNLGYRIQTDEQGGWRWQFVDGGNNEYFGVDYPSGNLIALGTITEQSSLRYKENIINLESITEKVDRLRPVRYNKIGNTNTEIGLIAEEVAEVFPEFVNYNADGEAESLNYTRLSVVLLQTVKELSDKINKLETK
jgi:hypothetical protein